jgi:hypothetical protein
MNLQSFHRSLLLLSHRLIDFAKRQAKETESLCAIVVCLSWKGEREVWLCVVIHKNVHRVSARNIVMLIVNSIILRPLEKIHTDELRFLIQGSMLHMMMHAIGKVVTVRPSDSNLAAETDSLITRSKRSFRFDSQISSLKYHSKTPISQCSVDVMTLLVVSG